jgi:glucose/arabinose dehydrogenase
MKITLGMITAIITLYGAGGVLAQQLPPGAGVAINPIDVDPATYLDRIRLPPGFRISLYADNVPGARSMSLGPDGTLYVGTRFNANRENIGKVYALRDTDGDHRADQRFTIAAGLNMSNGVAVDNGHLYVAELNRIIRFDNIAGQLNAPPAPRVIDDDFPDDWMHGWKFIRFGPDNKLYVPIGSPCNNCEPGGRIIRMHPDGSNREVFALGIRNSVGFDWHPQTGELWFTDNGRDMWGDDTPPDELNHAPVPGLHFGYPYRYGKALIDEDFNTDMSAEDFSPTALELPPHNAALGMRFYTGTAYPEKFHNQAFIALHGSWNRNVPDGYRVILARFENNRAVAWEDFATGWLTEDKQFWGRPVDIEIMPDGAILVSDDHAGVIYRISFSGE